MTVFGDWIYSINEVNVDAVQHSAHFFFFFSTFPLDSIVMAAAVVATPVCPKDAVPAVPKDAAMICAVCGSRKHMTSKLALEGFCNLISLS